MEPRRFAPVPTPVLPDERYHLPPLLDRAAATTRARDAICEGIFRPVDAEREAHIEDMEPLVVPFWRLDVTRTDDALTVTTIGEARLPIPGLRTRDARATWMVCARSAFPYEMKDPRSLFKGDAEPLAVSLAALVGGDSAGSPGWEVLDADVPEKDARRAAGAALKGADRCDEVVTASELTVHAVHFVRCPIWLARYRYKGVAAPQGGTYHVGISAYDGATVCARHPSKLRASVARVRGLVGSIGSALGRRKQAEEPAAETPPREPPPARGAPIDLKARFAEHVRREREKGR